MPELIAIEDHQIAGGGGYLTMNGLFTRHVFEYIAHQPAVLRLVQQSHQNGITGAFVIRRIVMVPDMITGFRVVIQRAGMGVIVGAKQEVDLPTG